MGARIFVVDDDPSVLRLMREMVESLGHETEQAASGEEALAKVEATWPDLILLDLNLPGMDGLEVLRRIRRLHGSVSTILFSGSLSVNDTVEAMKGGAFHCLAKPVSLHDLERTVNEAVSGLFWHKEISIQGLPDFAFVVASPAMKTLSRLVKVISTSPASTVLILGETGTGKELVARVLHRLSSHRAGNFVAVNCAAIPATLIESELFGHERGAFTDAKLPKAGLFEEAHEGTLFLDEIGELPLLMQSKLLRVLQERVVRRVGGSRDTAVNVRVLAASNSDLAAAVAAGKFREDLWYRLNVIPLVVPPLRERKEDILPLAECFCRQFTREFGRPVARLSPEDKAALLAYSWPGNVRELRNCVERAVLLDLGVIRPPAALGVSRPPGGRSEESAPPSQPPAAPEGGAAPAGKPAEPFHISIANPSLDNVERQLIIQVLTRVNGNKNHAANLLGINRTTLYRKLSSYGLEAGESEGAPVAKDSTLF